MYPYILLFLDIIFLIRSFSFKLLDFSYYVKNI